MSASRATTFSPARIAGVSEAGVSETGVSETESPTRRPLRQGSFVLAVAAALAVAGCTGGAGLDVPVGPVDHGCHSGQGTNLGGDGSGCS